MRKTPSLFKTILVLVTPIYLVSGQEKPLAFAALAMEAGRNTVPAALLPGQPCCCRPLPARAARGAKALRRPSHTGGALLRLVFVRKRAAALLQ